MQKFLFLANAHATAIFALPLLRLKHFYFLLWLNLVWYHAVCFTLYGGTLGNTLRIASTSLNRVTSSTGLTKVKRFCSSY